MCTTAPLPSGHLSTMKNIMLMMFIPVVVMFSIMMMISPSCTQRSTLKWCFLKNHALFHHHACTRSSIMMMNMVITSMMVMMTDPVGYSGSSTPPFRSPLNWNPTPTHARSSIMMMHIFIDIINIRRYLT